MKTQKNSCSGCANQRQSPFIIFVEDEHDFIEAAISASNSIVVMRRIKPLTREGTYRLALSLGGIQKSRAFGEIRSIRHDPNAQRSIALSLSGHPLHTDGSFMANPPGRFILAFAKSDPNGGGISTFVSLSAILAVAPEPVLSALFSADFRFARDDDAGFNDAFVGKILVRDEGGHPALRWRCDDRVRPLVVDAYGTDAEAAVRWVDEFLTGFGATQYAAQTGDVILIPNRRVLHGRTPLSPDSPREVFRAWIA